jgi:hypothetical protein
MPDSDINYKTWLTAKEVIIGMLKDLRPDMTPDVHDHNAAAILARMAHKDILCCHVNEIEFKTDLKNKTS